MEVFSLNKPAKALSGLTHPEVDGDIEGQLDYVEGGGDFNIGQEYDGAAAQQIKCAICGSTDYEIAQGSHLTVARCKYCRIEMVMHEG